MAVKKTEWLLVSDDLYAYEILGKKEQRYIYDLDAQKYYYQFGDEEPVEMEESEIQPEIVAELLKVINE